MRSEYQLLKWLGPWTPETKVPADVRRSSVDVGFEVFLYEKRNRSPRGAMLVCPGVHYAGPLDPRLDRFNRILATAGFLVMAPKLRDFSEMLITPQVIEDLDRALALLLARWTHPGIFSISFGSLPTLTVAARPERRDRLGGLVIFGGYADFYDAIRFCLTGEGRDPLNQPVLLMNLLADLPGAPEDPQPLLDAWRSYVEATWGRPEMKARERHEPIARTLAASLPEADRPLFLLGIGLQGDAHQVCQPILDRRAPDFLDPKPHLSQIRCPVHLVHGATDDVIPARHLDDLARAFPADASVQTYLTGLYGHTGHAGVAALSAAAKEATTLLRMLRAIVDVATRGRPT